MIRILLPLLLSATVMAEDPSPASDDVFGGYEMAIEANPLLRIKVDNDSAVREVRQQLLSATAQEQTAQQATEELSMLRFQKLIGYGDALLDKPELLINRGPGGKHVFDFIDRCVEDYLPLAEHYLDQEEQTHQTMMKKTRLEKALVRRYRELGVRPANAVQTPPEQPASTTLQENIQEAVATTIPARTEDVDIARAVLEAKRQQDQLLESEYGHNLRAISEESKKLSQGQQERQRERYRQESEAVNQAIQEQQR